MFKKYLMKRWETVKEKIAPKPPEPHTYWKNEGDRIMVVDSSQDKVVYEFLPKHAVRSSLSVEDFYSHYTPHTDDPYVLDNLVQEFLIEEDQEDE